MHCLFPSFPLNGLIFAVPLMAVELMGLRGTCLFCVLFGLALAQVEKKPAPPAPKPSQAEASQSTSASSGKKKSKHEIRWAFDP